MGFSNGSTTTPVCRMLATSLSFQPSSGAQKENATGDLDWMSHYSPINPLYHSSPQPFLPFDACAKPKHSAEMVVAFQISDLECLITQPPLPQSHKLLSRSKDLILWV